MIQKEAPIGNPQKRQNLMGFEMHMSQIWKSTKYHSNKINMELLNDFHQTRIFIDDTLSNSSKDTMKTLSLSISRYPELI